MSSRHRSRGVLALAAVLAAAAAFPGSSVSAPRGSAYLAAAESGIAQVHQVWWSPSAQWFTRFQWTQADNGGGTVTLWDLMPVFETYNQIALADPTAANRAAVDSVARHAEKYFNPAIKPVGGFTWRPGVADAFFDDSGWVGLNFMHAYAATHEQRYLLDAAKAFRFIAVAGWAKGGGVWWDTDHEKITAEPLAAEVLLGAEIYRATHKAWYLQTVQKFIAWADKHSWNAQRSLYQRNSTEDTVMNYIQGMMIGGNAILCSTLHKTSYCTKAEKLAQASQVAFPPRTTGRRNATRCTTRGSCSYGRSTTTGSGTTPPTSRASSRSRTPATTRACSRRAGTAATRATAASSPTPAR